MKRVAVFLQGLPGAVWIGLICAVVLAVAAWRIFDAGGDAVRAEVETREAAAVAVTTKTAAESQRDLDGETARIGDELAARQIETVRIVERTRVEIRDAAAAEPDALPRLTGWRDRAQRLRDDLCLDGPLGAERDRAGACTRTLRGPGAP